MKKDDIICMAREAGWIHEHDSETGFVAEAAFKFAKLIAAAEREACAQVCDVLAVHPEFASDVTKLAAMAIRSRGRDATA